jgi:hypothetical protein
LLRDFGGGGFWNGQFGLFEMEFGLFAMVFGFGGAVGVLLKKIIEMHNWRKV